MRNEHYSTEQLKSISRDIRIDIVKMLTNAGSGHLGGSLGLADIFTVLYFDFLNHNSNDPFMHNRDKLILSIGHVAPVLYVTLAHAGYFPVEELSSLRKINSRLQGHPSFNSGLPGVESASGSLGQGLSIAAGMALADKIDKIDRKIVCINGDGELQEGQIWEAAMSAGHHNLNNLISIVDRNNVQIDGKTSEVMDIEPLNEKWEAFGWNVLECDGNDIEDLIFVLEKMSKFKPNVIIANTKMGKGISEIEGDYNWHGKVPNYQECERFVKSLQG